MRFVPLAIFALMLFACCEAFWKGDWRYGVFWLLDAVLTGWSAYMLRP